MKLRKHRDAGKPRLWTADLCTLSIDLRRSMDTGFDQKQNQKPPFPLVPFAHPSKETRRVRHEAKSASEVFSRVDEFFEKHVAAVV